MQYILVSCFIFIFSAKSFSDDGAIKPMHHELRGEMHFSWYFFDVYHIKFWAPKGNAIFSKPLSLELKYKRKFSASEITNSSIDELKLNGVDQLELKKWKNKLQSIFPNIKVGDSILINFSPKDGLKFYLNRQKKLGGITDKRFVIAFMNIWLGEKTSEPKMRQNLLGES